MIDRIEIKEDTASKPMSNFIEVVYTGLYGMAKKINCPNASRATDESD